MLWPAPILGVEGVGRGEECGGLDVSGDTGVMRRRLWLKRGFGHFEGFYRRGELIVSKCSRYNGGAGLRSHYRDRSCWVRCSMTLMDESNHETAVRRGTESQ